MGTLPLPPLILLLPLVLFLVSSTAFSLTDDEVAAIARRQLTAFEMHGDHVHVDIIIDVKIANPRLAAAHRALRELKEAMYSDPTNFTGNWDGPDVCSYNGVLCAPAVDNRSVHAVAGLDLNSADIAGYLPREVGLLADLAFFHLNSNRFCGVIPEEIANLRLLYELDLSNNRFVGTFPEPVLRIPRLSYLDLRFNDFEGPIPPELFKKHYDAIFVNNNRFTGGIPDTIGESRASIIVLANNDLGGCVPRSIGRAAATLDELVFINNGLTGCLPLELGLLTNVTVFDVSGNKLTGAIPSALAGLSKVEQLDLSHNVFTGAVPKNVCELPELANFSFSYNFFNRAAAECTLAEGSDKVFDGQGNCMGGARPKQRPASACAPVVSRPVDCTKVTKCGWPSWKPKPVEPVPTPAPVASPPPPPPVHSPPPPPSPRPPPPPAKKPVILPPVFGSRYASPPPPLFPGY